jgi:hypothetical protein
MATSALSFGCARATLFADDRACGDVRGGVDGVGVVPPFASRVRVAESGAEATAAEGEGATIAPIPVEASE